MKDKNNFRDENWGEIKLDEKSLSILTGFPFKSDLYDRQEGIPLIRIRDLGKETTEIKYRGEFEEKYIVEKNDILIGMDGEFNIVKWNGPTALLNQRVAKISTLDKKIDKDFLFYALKLPLKKIEKEIWQTTVKHLSTKHIRNIKINIPSIELQKEIANILSQVESLSYMHDSKIQILLELKAGLLSKIFTDITSNGNYIKSEKLGRITKIITGGTPNRSNPSYWNGEIPWITTSEIRYKDIYDSKEKITDIGLKESSAKIIPKNSVLMAMYGQGVTRGRVAILRIESAINQACAAILPNEIVLPEYLFYFLTYKYEQIRNLAHGANQQNLNLDLIKNIEIPVLEKEQQRKLSEILMEIDNNLNLEIYQKTLYEELFYSAMDQFISKRLITENSLS